MKWKEIETNHIFEDGSVVTQVRSPERFFCYRFWLKKHPRDVKDNSITVSEDHYILCDLSRLSGDWISYISTTQPNEIPVVEDLHVYKDENGCFKPEVKPVKNKSWCFDEKRKLYWISAKNIFLILEKFGNKKIKPYGNKIIGWEAVGFKQCFCVSTDTGRYTCCGVVNSNSVTLRNIIFHALTHSDDIKIGLVDLKQSEFSRYKGMNNVVGVANSTREACELLRLAREIMQKRNLDNANKDITDFVDYDPKKPTNKISLFGREFDDSTTFEVEVGGEKKTMTADEILQYVEQNY